MTSCNILGIDPRADAAEAKRAYKAAVRQWHPDQFPKGSATQIQAEERLKQINIAYARVREHLTQRQPEASSPPAAGGHTAGDREPATDNGPAADKPKSSWVDQLFNTLNRFAAGQARDAQCTEATERTATSGSRNRFEQVMEELAGEGFSRHPRSSPGRPAGRRKGPRPGYRHARRGGGMVDAIGGTERVGPVRPVDRVRGIGKNR